ncbi:hypothetical protein TRVL_08440 [Trypanosoma vivax]|nr:hypothetical protein TRVL_08440 [Trypanosoma vivax]
MVVGVFDMWRAVASPQHSRPPQITVREELKINQKNTEKMSDKKTKLQEGGVGHSATQPCPTSCVLSFSPTTTAPSHNWRAVRASTVKTHTFTMKSKKETVKLPSAGSRPVDR